MSWETESVMRCPVAGKTQIQTGALSQLACNVEDTLLSAAYLCSLQAYEWFHAGRSKVDWSWDIMALIFKSAPLKKNIFGYTLTSYGFQHMFTANYPGKLAYELRSYHHKGISMLEITSGIYSCLSFECWLESWYLSTSYILSNKSYDLFAFVCNQSTAWQIQCAPNALVLHAFQITTANTSYVTNI